MSRAFVKETDEVFEELPERPISPHANLVTERGLQLIESQIARLGEALATAQAENDRVQVGAISRDLRYWRTRRASAEVVPEPEDAEAVRFGHSVIIERDDGRRQRFKVVGEDEADPAKGLLSYVSPLARALIGKRVGDVVAAGQGEAEIVSIDVPTNKRD
jgi:transcription elongation GreA/GreB family factor